MEASELWVGFVGAGRMAGGLVRGLLQAGKVPASNVLASAPSDKNLDAWRELGCRTTHCNLEVVHRSTLVFLATKPHILPGVLEEIRPAVGSHHIVVSLVAGVTIQTLQRAGAMVFSRGSNAGDEEAALLKSLLSSCGLCEEVPESYIDIHTGLSGSGVAYVYLFAEALAEGAVKMGMPGALASRIAAQTLLGAAKMLLETGEHPAKLRGDVCTPGGTTIYALHQLEKGALRATVMDAVEAATNRACDMAKD
ncbi:pyrroline-5-carboxylate reductase 3 isoform X2 [Anomalospiza imberbis]|uniref:pyrroline-5-carboxylate reductase 3 isoform X2 n=1 Tax=Motacilla alba alba TaxID=1094192 RepID=UPI0018D596D8|nr:pyrroline-5-carboxylate reductase 3 isoform X2 [Motacilla alba alba]